MPLKQIALNRLPAPALRLIRSIHYRRQLKNYPVAREPDLEGCKALLRSGDTVLDIGANIGVYTRFCSQFVGPTGTVHSLEPIPETYSYLSGNVRALGLRNVTCHNVAASDHDQADAAMSMPDYASGGPNIYEARLSADGEIPVRTVRLDTLFPNLSPRLIKCDVEGHEIACIEGASDLITRCKPSWVVEVSSSRTFGLFDSLGYDAFIWAQTGFRSATPSDKVPNYFFFDRDRLPAQHILN